MSQWCSYSEPCFLPTPGYWWLVGQPFPNDSPKAILNVYCKSKGDMKRYSSPGTSTLPSRRRHPVCQ